MGSMRRSVVALAGGALLLAGCASSTGTTSQQQVQLTPAAAVQAAYSTTTAAGSAKLTMSMVVAAGGQTMTMKASGPLRLDGTRGDITATMSSPQLGGGEVNIHELVYDKTLYMKLGIPGMPDTWFKVDATTLAKTSGLSGLSGATGMGDQFKQLQSLLDVTKVGTETVNGVQTTHYSGSVDATKLSSLLAGTGAASELQSAAATASIPVDVWVDSSGHVVRIRERASMTVKGQSVAVSVQLDLSDFGVAVNVTPPAGAKDLSSLLGSLGG